MVQGLTGFGLYILHVHGCIYGFPIQLRVRLIQDLFIYLFIQLPCTFDTCLSQLMTATLRALKQDAP